MKKKTARSDDNYGQVLNDGVALRIVDPSCRKMGHRSIGMARKAPP